MKHISVLQQDNLSFPWNGINSGQNKAFHKQNYWNSMAQITEMKKY